MKHRLQGFCGEVQANPLPQTTYSTCWGACFNMFILGSLGHFLRILQSPTSSDPTCMQSSFQTWVRCCCPPNRACGCGASGGFAEPFFLVPPDTAVVSYYAAPIFCQGCFWGASEVRDPRWNRTFSLLVPLGDAWASLAEAQEGQAVLLRLPLQSIKRVECQKTP